MIATFLRAELDSDRWGPTLRELLARDGLDEALVRRPDLESAADNGRRRTLLEEHRGYERRAGLFFGFPKQVWDDLKEQGRIGHHPVFPDSRGPAARICSPTMWMVTAIMT